MGKLCFPCPMATGGAVFAQSSHGVLRGIQPDPAGSSRIHTGRGAALRAGGSRSAPGLRGQRQREGGISSSVSISIASSASELKEGEGGPSVQEQQQEQQEQQQQQEQQEQQEQLDSLRALLSRSTVRVVECLREWDAEQSGAVTKAQFRRSVAKMGLDVPKAVTHALFDSWDPDGAGAQLCCNRAATVCTRVH